jgi:hypothetical protein
VVDTQGRPATFKRYPTDSVKFSDARPSTLGEVQVGDQLRALGDRNGEGVLQAEQLVFGTFQIVSGAVASVDAASGTVVLKDDTSKQSVSVQVGPDARLRSLPPEMAARLLARRAAGAEGAPERPANAGPGGSPEGGPPGARGHMNPDALIERMPTAALGDIKAGSRVLVSSTKGTDATHLNAIVLVTGLESLIVAAPGPRRGGRGMDVGLPGELMDLGMALQ